MSVAILRYNGGNTASVANALARMGVESVISDDADVLRSADRVIFPGVGEASTAMAYLRERGLDQVVRSLTQPVLAICLGMQLLCASSEENETECLGIVPYRVRKFAHDGVKVPHMGWNRLLDLRPPLFAGVKEDVHVYFVHSYFVEKGLATTAACEYGELFSAALHHQNFYSVQFHPEKSGEVGQRILQNFLNV